ncbi:hypothetical protein PJ985_07660 [Streptomyces sp. ACA25]|uniref:hypothetical protein n=1 Tax=Streptomyces sp. ACA25 TaxID=3022596 RepID=UPI002307EDD5|nr:hypothetical protein [Streptomyces sp. ACA25]MDB1087439.1 hypothetical protein [Streptomyces sp. ACA25]
MSYGQGGLPGGSGGSQWDSPQTPDWSALAAEADRTRARRRRLVIGGGAVAALAVGTLVALAIVHQSGGGDDGAAGGPSVSAPAETDVPTDAAGAEPTFAETSLPPLPKPHEFVSDADKDTAPFTPEEFFAGDTMTVDGREYTRVTTHAAEDCSLAVTENLAAVLGEHGCAAFLRATYVADGVAVTVGVGQFGTVEDAAAAKAAATPHVRPLTGEGVPAFCDRGGCRTTSNQAGRYAYFTLAGNSDNTPDSGDGTPAQQAARDGNDHAYARIVQRGEAQASASASALVEERRGTD